MKIIVIVFSIDKFLKEKIQSALLIRKNQLEWERSRKRDRTLFTQEKKC